jgi:hypothetical protein
METTEMFLTFSFSLSLKIGSGVQSIQNSKITVMGKYDFPPSFNKFRDVLSASS